jgi:hypothetical protein
MASSETIEACRKVAIERAHGLTPQTFHQRYLSGCGQPVIITDAVTTWKAWGTWSFDQFKSLYGSEGVVASVWPGDKFLKMMLLRDYIDYLDAPGGPSPGFWIDPATKFPCDAPPEAAASPLYLSGWRTFSRHPELLEDIVLSPQFVEDWLPLLPQALREAMDEATRYFSAGVLIGPAGSLANLHQDFLHSHAYLAQIIGRKRCILFSPDDSAALYDGKIDPDRPDFLRFPRLRHATAFECILEPGELLFMPCNWWHHVVALEKSMTVNYNFFNGVNFSAYLTALLRDLPAIVNGLEKSPGAKVALGIGWVCKGFDLSKFDEEQAADPTSVL